MPVLQAKIKSISSGDTVILTNPKGAERTLSLAYISAPRLRRDGDELFAFQSREFLREQVVGKVVTFDVLYTIPTTNREYGKVTLPSGLSFPEQVLAQGWAKLRDDAGKNDQSEDMAAYLEKLRNLEASAKNAALGIWSPNRDRIEVSHDVADPTALVGEYRGKPLEGIIEKVLTGDRLILRLLVAPLKHIQTILVMAGIRAPSTKRTSPEGREIPAELGGTEAHQFVEERLLLRKCAIQLVGSTPQSQLIGSVIHPKGNIAKFLLEAGLARCNDQHVTILGNDMSGFREAEKVARLGGKGVFAGQAITKSVAGGATDADYTVARILNADTIFVRPRAGQEKKISLSSVRQPKPSDPKQSPFSGDAKEFLRKKVIGKHVKVRVDGKKPPSEGFEEREVATVSLNGKNVALMLVEAGYASVIRHRRDDDDRSSDYDALLLAEEAAQKDGKGMWSSKPSAAKQYQDYSESLQKAKMEASVLQRQKRVPAIVDFVRSASRFVVLVPRENAKLTFVLSGIRAPKSARNPEEKSEPFGQEAHDFANRRCMQRDVEIDVENIDKVGGFIGTLYINRENMAKLLVEEGLAEVHAYSAEQSGHGNELFLAEKKAKEAKKGLWHDWDPSKDEEYPPPPAQGGSAATTNATNGDSTATSTKQKDYRDVLVTHVDSSTGHLKLQQIGSNTTGALTDLMNAFRTFHLSPTTKPAPISSAPKVGDVLAGQFSADKEWYRVRIRRVDRDSKTAEVVYIDYGNSESVPWTNLRPLTQPQFTTQKLKPQAVDAVLSFLQLPTSPQYLSDYVAYVTETTDGHELVASVDHVAADKTGTSTLHVTLHDPENSSKVEESINADVIKQGLATVSRKGREQRGVAAAAAAGMTIGSELLDKLTAFEDEAKEERRGMWEYGDLTED